MSEDLTQLNRDAIAAAKHYMGQVSWPTIVLAVGVVVAFATNLAWYANGTVNGLTATLILAALTYMSYTPLHEAAHGNINGNREDLQWLNDLCGYLVAPLIAVPYASHRREHFTHHRYTNQPDKDPDFMISGIAGGPLQAVITIFKFVWLQNTFFVKHGWQSASRRERVVYGLEVTVSLGWRIAFIALSGSLEAAGVILLGYLMGGLFTAYWFAYRPHLPYENATRYQNTSSLLMPRWMKPLEWFWLGQNLHSIHHLFPRVPFYRYHALHRDIEPILRAHGTPIVGIFSRDPIPADGPEPSVQTARLRMDTENP